MSNDFSLRQNCSGELAVVSQQDLSRDWMTWNIFTDKENAFFSCHWSQEKADLASNTHLMYNVPVGYDLLQLYTTKHLTPMYPATIIDIKHSLKSNNDII